MHVIVARLPDHAVEHGEVVTAGLGLDLVPFDRREDCIEPGRLQSRPGRFEEIEAGRARIGQFSAQDEIGLTTDVKLLRRAVVDQPRRLHGRRDLCGGSRRAGGDQRRQGECARMKWMTFPHGLSLFASFRSRGTGPQKKSGTSKGRTT